MKTALLIDFVVLMLLTFFCWLFPDLGKKSREVCEDWWLSFSDLDPHKIGSFVATIITRRLDASLGASLLGRRFFWVSFLLSQIIFVLIFLWISIAWGVITYGNIDFISFQISSIFQRIKHVLIPLLVFNTIFDIISLGITREILRKASSSKTLRAFTGLIGVDCLAAFSLVLLSALFFSNFYFSPGGLISILLFIVYLSFVPAVVFAILGVVALFGRLSEKKPDSPLLSRTDDIVFALILMSISAIIFGLAIKNSFYTPYLNLDFSDISLVIILAVSLTAAFPSFLNLIALMLMFLLRLVSNPAHKFISYVLLRIAETKRGVIFVSVVALTMLKDLFTIILIK